MAGPEDDEIPAAPRGGPPGAPRSGAMGPHYGEQRIYGLAEEIPVLIDGLEIGRILVREVLL